MIISGLGWLGGVLRLGSGLCFRWFSVGGFLVGLLRYFGCLFAGLDGTFAMVLFGFAWFWCLRGFIMVLVALCFVLF